MGAIGCLLIIVVFCALKCTHKSFSRDCICKEQVAGFIGLTTMSAITNKEGEMLGVILPGFRDCSLINRLKTPMARAE